MDQSHRGVIYTVWISLKMTPAVIMTIRRVITNPVVESVMIYKKTLMPKKTVIATVQVSVNIKRSNDRMIRCTIIGLHN